MAMAFLASALVAMAATAWAGNDSYTYTFNSADQLTSVGWQYGQIATFTYDGENLRIRKTAPDGSGTIYIRDADGNVIAEYDQDGDLIAEYVFVNGRRVCKINPDGTRRYYQADQVGTPQLITDDAGQVVWRGDTMPFGEQYSSEGEADSHLLTGKELDEEFGLYYFNARYYDPEIGRFISVDPVAGRNEDPQSWNRYAYARDNPLRFLDPDGNEFEEVTLYQGSREQIQELYGEQELRRFDKHMAVAATLTVTTLAGSPAALRLVPALLTYSITLQGQQLVTEFLEALGPNPSIGTIRSEYMKRSKALVETAEAMIREGATAEAAARALVPIRNDLKAAAREAGPWWAARWADARNLLIYHNRLGPSADAQFAKYKSWEKVIENLGETSKTWDKLAN